MKRKTKRKTMEKMMEKTKQKMMKKTMQKMMKKMMGKSIHFFIIFCINFSPIRRWSKNDEKTKEKEEGRTRVNIPKRQSLWDIDSGFLL